MLLDLSIGFNLNYLEPTLEVIYHGKTDRKPAENPLKDELKAQLKDQLGQTKQLADNAGDPAVADAEAKAEVAGEAKSDPKSGKGEQPKKKKPWSAPVLQFLDEEEETEGGNTRYPNKTITGRDEGVYDIGGFTNPDDYSPS